MWDDLMPTSSLRRVLFSICIVCMWATSVFAIEIPCDGSQVPPSLSPLKCFAETVNPWRTPSIGWGAMNPLIIDLGDKFYVPFRSPSGIGNPDVIGTWLGVLENGGGRSTDLFVKDVSVGIDQPPGVFYIDGQMVVIFMKTAAVVGMKIIDTRLADSTIGHKVVQSAEFGANDFALGGIPGATSLNYMGGSVDQDGTIYVAGWLTQNNGERNALGLLRIKKDAGAWRIEGKGFGPCVVAEPFSCLNVGNSYQGANAKAFEPLYPHVIVRNSGQINILLTIHNYQTCLDTGKAYTGYKSAILFEGTWESNQLKAVFKDLTDDAKNHPETNGDPCLGNWMRYPEALIYDPATDTTYSIIERRSAVSTTPGAQEDPSQRHFDLWKNDSIWLRDLEEHFFRPPTAQTENRGFDRHRPPTHITVSKLDSGAYVFVASAEEGHQAIGDVIIATESSDGGINFSRPTEVKMDNFTFGGISGGIKINQGYKNVWLSDKKRIGVNRLIFWFNGYDVNAEKCYSANQCYSYQYYGGVSSALPRP